MNNQTRYLQDINRLEDEMKAISSEIDERVRLKANTGPLEFQYRLREDARAAMLALVRDNGWMGS